MDQLIQVLIIGLANGLIFALVALGYTLVYGIIELINFAHGDVFMLGSMLAYFLIAPASAGAWGVFPITADTPLPLLIAQILAVLAICMVAMATLNVAHRADRLPTAAQRAEARPLDLGDRRELRPPERRPGLGRRLPAHDRQRLPVDQPARAVRDHDHRDHRRRRCSSASSRSRC